MAEKKDVAKKKLKLIVESHGRYLPCALSKFTINGIAADEDDFGDTETDPQDEPYTCKNHRFVPKMPSQEVLNKYKIGLGDYAEICSALKETLYVGYCGMCI